MNFSGHTVFKLNLACSLITEFALKLFICGETLSQQIGRTLLFIFDLCAVEYNIRMLLNLSVFLSRSPL